MNYVQLYLKKHFLALFGALLLIPVLPLYADDASADGIIDQYVQATQTHQNELHGGSMQVQIDASVPKLKQHGRLYALRKISKVGTVTYHVLGFQGNNTVKKEVIARYLQAEQQNQSNAKLALVPANYKFKYKGKQRTNQNEDVYVFHVAPRTKRVGLFKGEVWLDSRTFLPVYEKGRLVKNPSIFFKRVDFERNYAIEHGIPIPHTMTSTINTRLVGKIELNVSYSNFAPDTEPDESTVAPESNNVSAISVNK